MVLPSEYEPFAVVVNEAMLCGCPVAASDRVGAARDLIAHGRTGFVYPCGDLEALAAVLRQATSGERKLSVTGRAARARMDSWSPRDNIEATLSAVARAVSRIPRLGDLMPDSSPATAAKSSTPGARRP
jgi:glycosyltransferase involved in cell wall biosynthesis